MCSQITCEEISKEQSKYIDPVVNSTKPFPLDDAKAWSNPHNDTILSIYICSTTSSKSSCAD